MKKFILGLLILLFAYNVSASFVFSGTCPEKVICPENTMQGDDGKCYPCNYPEVIGVYCIGGWEVAEKICPNRKMSAIGWSSYLNCPSDKYIEKDGVCKPKCPEGYEGNELDGCKNPITGKSYVVRY